MHVISTSEYLELLTYKLESLKRSEAEDGEWDYSGSIREVDSKIYELMRLMEKA